MKSLSSIAICAGAAASLLALSAYPPPARASEAAPAATASSRPVPENFSFFAAGDLLGPFGSSLPLEDPELVRLGSIVRAADAAFANQEGNSFDIATYNGSLAAENGGGYPIHSLEVTRAFRDFGLDLISRANNHSADYGVEGLLASDIAMDAVGLTRAGTGASLEAARAPGYYQSPNGKAALVATASTFTRMSPAGAPARGVGARPGLSPLHVQPVRLVTASEFAALRGIVLRQGWIGYPLPGKTAKEFQYGEEIVRVAKEPGLTYEVSEKDVAELLGSVRQADSEAGFVAFSIHAHETKSGGGEDEVPPDFLRSLFHQAIDAGADAVVRHGPHAVHGIEIYKGRPIFYSLGSLFFDLPRSLKVASDGPNQLTLELPASWWEGAVATSKYERGSLRQIIVHPLIIDPQSSARPGLPRIATGADAVRILSRIEAASRPFGTRLAIKDGVGIIDLPARSAR